jgi:ABC-2 type transport system ATP-binding protein
VDQGRAKGLNIRHRIYRSTDIAGDFRIQSLSYTATELGVESAVQSDQQDVNNLDQEPNLSDLHALGADRPDRSDRADAVEPREIVLQTSDLTKRYRTGFWLTRKATALQKVSLTVYAGETFGLLGQNGAGKTTLLKTLLGIVRPSQGRALLLGKPLGNRSAKQRIGYLPENPYFYDYLTGQEILKFTAGLFGLSAAVQKERIPALIELVGLDPRTARKKQLRQYSKGMLQRIGLAQALINDPELVFLDEPMSGLDPLGRYQMREIIQSLKQQGKTIFFNSHVLSDVEKLCDRVAILDRGELICAGTLQELLGDAQAYTVRVRGGNPEVLKQRINGLQFQDGCWTGQLRGDPQDFVASLRLIKAQLVSMQLARPSLEEFFVHQLKERGLS